MIPAVHMAIPFDVDRLEITGKPVRLGTLDRIFDFAVSSDGTLIYFQPSQTTGLVWVDRQGHVEGLAEVSKQFGAPRLSPDGRRFVVQILDDRFRNNMTIVAPINRTECI